jgi:hypothetical protein
MESSKRQNKTRRCFFKEITGAAFCFALAYSKQAAAVGLMPGQNVAEREKAPEAGLGNESLVAVCGLYCGACPMYLATQSNDEQQLLTLLKRFSSGQLKLGMEDILCDGCLGNGRVASFCRSCAIRECPTNKPDVTRCSDCSDFECPRITDFNNDGMLHHAEVLDNLRSIRKLGIGKWAKYEQERWSCPQCSQTVSWYDSQCSACGAARSKLLFQLVQR